MDDSSLFIIPFHLISSCQSACAKYNLVHLHVRKLFAYLSLHIRGADSRFFPGGGVTRNLPYYEFFLFWFRFSKAIVRWKGGGRHHIIRQYICVGNNSNPYTRPTFHFLGCPGSPPICEHCSGRDS